MPVTIWETPNSRQAGINSVSREYYASADGGDEGDIVDALLAFAPTSFGAWGVTDYSVEEVDSDYDLWQCSVTWGQGNNSAPEIDAVEYTFNYQAPSVHIYQSLATISVTGSGAPDFKGAINVVQDGGKLKVEGYSLAPPPVCFTIGYYPSASAFTSGYQSTLRGLVGKVNSDTYQGAPAGSALLAQVSGGIKNNDQANIQFGFSFVENATSIPVGDLTVSAKDGFDLLWPYYEDAIDSDDLVKSPVAAYVERIYYRSSFAALP